MRKYFYSACILALALSVNKAHAQTGVAINDNNATADQSAILDVNVNANNKKGFLLPRVTTIQRDGIALPAKGLMVYVTNVDSLEINTGTPTSPTWTAFGLGPRAWNIRGNTGTTIATDFLGTYDGMDLGIRTNNIERMRILAGGNIGINTTAPSNRLTVVATNPLALYGVTQGTQTSTDSILTISNGIVKKIPSVGVVVNSSNYWSLSGNSTTSAFLGTTNDYALSFRVNNTLSGYIGKSSEGSTAFGYNSNAITWATGATAIGANAQATSGNTTAVGSNAQATSNPYASSFGADSKASNTNATALGGKSSAAGNATAVGYNAVAPQESVVIGSNAAATSNENVVIGVSAAATYQSIAIGKLAETDANNCIAIGYNSNARNQNSIAIGLNVTTPASNDMISIGNSSNSSVLFCGASDNSKALVVGTGNSNGNGAYLSKGGVWNNASDKNLKDGFSKVSGADVLAKVMALDVTKWKYKGTNEYHIGPMAQDFFAAFGLGTDDKHISSIDPSGVALVAIQELKKENEALTKRVDDQQKLLEQLLKEVNELKAKVK